MKTNELLSNCESAVANVEQKLSDLTELERSKSVLQGNLQHIASQRAEALTGTEPEVKKVAKMKDLDLAAEVKRMDLAKQDAQIGNCKQHIVALAIDANGKVQALKDAMILAAKSEAKAVLLEVWPAKVVDLLATFLNQASSVKALDVEYITFTPAKIDFCLAQARKLRPILETLKGNAPTAKPVEAPYKKPVAKQIVATGNALGAVA